MTTPYTYLLGWSNLNTFYYGVRYATNCNPSDLWTKYKTSSKYVKQVVSEHGEPDIIEIRKIFSDKRLAKKWEDIVLRRIGAVSNPKFLNKANLNSFKEVIFDDEVRKNHKAAIEKIVRVKRRCINDGQNHKYIPISDTLPVGWFEGMSQHRCEQNKINRQLQLQSFSKEQIAEIGRKISAKTKGKPKPPNHGANVSKATKGVPKPWQQGDKNVAKRPDVRKKISNARQKNI